MIIRVCSELYCIDSAAVDPSEPQKIYCLPRSGTLLRDSNAKQFKASEAQNVYFWRSGLW